MRVTYVRAGGVAFFPGLNAPFVLDAATLVPAEAGRLRALIERAKVFDLPLTSHRSGPPKPDTRTYTLLVEDGARHARVALVDPITDAAMADLVAFLEHARHPANPD